MADKDVVKGQIKQVQGKAENAVGNLTGDIETQAKGAAKQVAGKAEEDWGRLKDAIRNETERKRAEKDFDRHP